MSADARIRSAFEAMMAEIDVPAVPLTAIATKVLLPQPAPPRRSWTLVAVAAAAAVLLVLGLPAMAPGFVQSAAQRIAAILQWTPPPRAPQSVLDAMRVRSGDLASAQARVPFTIVAPKGLPSDVVSETIHTTTPGVYSNATRTWSTGPASVFFVYRRSGGRSFMLLASRYDPADEAPSKYTFEDMDKKRNGQEVIVRRDKFVWRNGDQVTTANTGDGIDAAEIDAIRAAMGGTPIPGVWPPARATRIKMYRLP